MDNRTHNRVSRIVIPVIAAIMSSFLLTACFSENAKEDDVDGALKYINKADEKSSGEDTPVIPEEDLHKSYIEAIGVDYNSAAPEDGTISAMFTIKDFDMEEKTLSFIAYTEEIYDGTQISLMQIGDTLCIDGKEIVVESIQDKESDLIINGGEEEGGIDLMVLSDGTYRAHKMDDYASYVEIGRSTLPLSEDLVINDSYKDASIPMESDLEGLETYLGTLDGASDAFSYTATKITIKNGKVTEIVRRWTP